MKVVFERKRRLMVYFETGPLRKACRNKILTMQGFDTPLSQYRLFSSVSIPVAGAERSPMTIFDAKDLISGEQVEIRATSMEQSLLQPDNDTFEVEAMTKLHKSKCTTKLVERFTFGTYAYLVTAKSTHGSLRHHLISNKILFLTEAEIRSGALDVLIDQFA